MRLSNGYTRYIGTAPIPGNILPVVGMVIRPPRRITAAAVLG
jgi:hypothetical protein